MPPPKASKLARAAGSAQMTAALAQRASPHYTWANQLTQKNTNKTSGDSSRGKTAEKKRFGIAVALPIPGKPVKSFNAGFPLSGPRDRAARR